ncbi:MAG: serine/threonine protein kinase [Myxococcota bacterium]|nr:serine/threonine protein kinase [Myxococcota bacterium]
MSERPTTSSENTEADAPAETTENHNSMTVPPRGQNSVHAPTISAERIQPWVIPSRRVVQELIGEGGMGKVHAATEEILHRQVAIKTLQKENDPDSVHWKRFVREAQVTAQLAHPSIVPVYGIEFDQNHQPSLIMKKLEGQTLTQYIKECRAKPEADGYTIKERLEKLLQVCSAVSYAHEHGVVHRDLKPSNIMVGDFDEVIVMDWGTARIMREPLDSSKTVPIQDFSLKTVAGSLLGTPKYMPPEQAQGKIHAITAATDQFALGLILFELVTLTPAREAKNVRDFIRKAMKGDIAPFPSFFPPPLRAIVQKTTQIEAANRYPSIEDLMQDLRRFIHGEPVSVYPEGLGMRILRTLSQHPAASISLFMGSILISLVLIINSLQSTLEHQTQLQEREERTARLIETVSKRAKSIDSLLIRTQLHLHGLTRAASLKYKRPSEEPPCVDTESIKDLEGSFLHPKHGVYISLSEPVCLGALGVDRALSADSFELGGSIRPDLISALGYAQKSLPSKERYMSTDNPSEIQWAYMGTADGVLISYPGLSFYPEGYDPRKRPWYGSGKEHVIPNCGNPYPDASGTGYLLPCTQRVESISGEFIGVAGIDLSLDSVIDIIDAQKSFLLNDSLEIMLRSSDRGIQMSSEEAMDGNVEKKREILKIQRLRDELERQALNGVIKSEDGSTTYAYMRLQFAPWILVLSFSENGYE